MWDKIWNLKNGLCPLSCKKYEKALYKQDVACLAANKLRDQKQDLLPYRDKLESLCNLLSEGYQILGVSKNRTDHCVIFMDHVNQSKWDHTRIIWLHKLPFQHRQDYIGSISFELHTNCTAHIIECSSRIPNMGYGSILMNQLIIYLRSAGFRTLTGNICPTDFGHEDKLRHFYTKFGFKITDYPNRRALHLDLLEKETKPMYENNCLVCCRSDDHRRLSSEALLADDKG